MIYQFGQVTLDTAQFRLSNAGETVSVEPLAFDLLVYLVENRDRVVSREELLEKLWQGKVVSDAALASRLKDARKAIGDSGTRQQAIKTLHGRGYQFIAELSQEGLAPAEPPPTHITTTSEPATLPDQPSIAVMPFINMSDDAGQEYFSDGIAEEIITALSYFAGLFVTSRNSSFSYKDRSVEARTIARELGVRYLLEGSVQRQNDRLRINARLINARDGNQIWAQRFDGDLGDIFALQDEITHAIVGSIAPQIELAEIERGRALDPASLTSYELSLKAKSQTYDAFRNGNAAALQEAINTAAQALALDGRNTHALWILGVAYLEQYFYQWSDDPMETVDRAMEMAEQLVHVNSANAAVYILRASGNVMRREFHLAQADFDRGLSLNRNAAIHLFFAAWGESLAGRTEQAKQHAELGLRLSPKEMDLFVGLAYLSLLQASFAEENFEEAIEWGRLAIQMQARAPTRRVLMVACCAYIGNLDEARQHAEALNAFAPDVIPAILRNEMLLYESPTHNRLLVDGLQKAGLVTAEPPATG